MLRPRLHGYGDLNPTYVDDVEHVWSKVDPENENRGLPAASHGAKNWRKGSTAALRRGRGARAPPPPPSWIRPCERLIVDSLAWPNRKKHASLTFFTLYGYPLYRVVDNKKIGDEDRRPKRVTSGPNQWMDTINFGTPWDMGNWTIGHASTRSLRIHDLAVPYDHIWSDLIHMIQIHMWLRTNDRIVIVGRD